MGLFRTLFQKSDGEDLFYSDKWMRNASDEELVTEREKVRLKHCSGDERAQRVLWQFDNEMSRRAWAGHEDDENKFPVHSEHGWYLPEDDD